MPPGENALGTGSQGCAGLAPAPGCDSHTAFSSARVLLSCLSVCLTVSIYTLSLSTSKLTISLKLLNSQKPKTQTVESLKYTFFPGREFECTPSWDAPCQVHCPQCTEMLQTRLKSTYN